MHAAGFGSEKNLKLQKADYLQDGSKYVLTVFGRGPWPPLFN